MVTDRLYYSDCYLREFDANIVEATDGSRRVYLDRTAFYPASGGQPFDLGSIGGERVIEVLDEESRIAHILAAPLQTDQVHGEIDWPRRYDHMQQHTGQHLLSAVLAELFQFQTVSFHMGEDLSTIELATKELTEEQVNRAEKYANALARTGAPLRIGFEDSNEVTGLRKQSGRGGLLRIVEIPGIDKSACGGTHVRSIAETCPIQIRRMEKIRGNVRIEFVCGERACERAKKDFRVMQELARQSASPPDKLTEHFAVLKARLADAEKERQKLANELAQREGRELYAATPPDDRGVRRVKLSTEQIDDSARLKAIAFALGTKALMLVVGENPAGVLIASSADSGVHAGAVLKKVLSAAGGRGGGSATLAQGSLPEAPALLALSEALGFGND